MTLNSLLRHCIWHLPVSPTDNLRADTFDDHCVHSPRADDFVPILLGNRDSSCNAANA
jgi:hypothetical protein